MSESLEKSTEKRLIAVCGKGGTGKTASIAMMARALVEDGRAGRLLLIDADPAMGLLSALGVSVRRTMGEVREEIIKTAKRGKEEDKAHIGDMIEYMLFEALTEADNYSVLAMGRTETLGCYCPVNSLLRGAIETLSKNFDTILIDGEAGLEQINRQVVRELHTLLIITDPTARGLETADVIQRMIRVDNIMDCQKLGLVFNRVRGNEQLLRDAAAKLDLDIAGMIPFDEIITEHDLIGRPVTDLPADSPALSAVRDVIGNYVLA
jgi:CO dehydrogenase maturation factor